MRLGRKKPMRADSMWETDMYGSSNMKKEAIAKKSVATREERENEVAKYSGFAIQRDSHSESIYNILSDNNNKINFGAGLVWLKQLVKFTEKEFYNEVVGAITSKNLSVDTKKFTARLEYASLDTINHFVSYTKQNGDSRALSKLHMLIDRVEELDNPSGYQSGRQKAELNKRKNVKKQKSSRGVFDISSDPLPAGLSDTERDRFERILAETRSTRANRIANITTPNNEAPLPPWSDPIAFRG